MWLYYRFPLSFREVEEMMLQRGIAVSHETIRQWCAKFGQTYANGLRRRRARHSGHLPTRNQGGDQVFRNLLKGLEYVPRVLVTDKLGSYAAAHRRVLRSVEHRQSKYLNNRVEISHQPTRARERAIKKFCLRAQEYREYRSEMASRFTAWNEVVGLPPAADKPQSESPRGPDTRTATHRALGVC